MRDKKFRLDQVNNNKNIYGKRHNEVVQEVSNNKQKVRESSNSGGAKKTYFAPEGVCGS